MPSATPAPADDVESSAAFVVLPRDASDPAGVLALADERLYAEKARRGSLAAVPKLRGA